MFVPDVLQTQRPPTSREIRVCVSALLCILIPEIEVQDDDENCRNYNGAQREAIATVVVWRVRVNMGGGDGQALAN